MFWVERLARLTGFNRLSKSLLGDERYAPYLLVITVVFIDMPVLSTIRVVYIGKGSVWWRWPDIVWWMIPVIAVLAILFLRGLRNRHNSMVRKTGRIDDGNLSKPEFSERLQYGMLIFGLSIYVTWVSTLNLFELESLMNDIIILVKWFLIIPVIYIPIATDLATAYFHVQLVLPYRIQERDIPLDFSDPRHLGGMYPVGKMMSFAAISAFIALALYTILWVLVPWEFTQLGQQIITSFFVSAWIAATGAFLIGLYIVHRHMRQKRQEELDRIHENVRKLGDDGETFPYTEPRDNDEFQEHVQEYVNLDRVEQTSTFPFNVIVAWEMFAAALFPVVLQVISIIAPSSL